MKARRQAGISIIEMMVGLMVGTLVTLSAWGTVMFYEANRRTGIGGNSALENGLATALAIQRDVKSAGLGFVFGGVPACSKLNVYYNGVTTSDGQDIAPVVIVDGGAGSDQVSVAYSGSDPRRRAGAHHRRAWASPGDLIRIGTTGNLTAGNMMLVASPNGADPCTLMQATNASRRRLRHRDHARRERLEPQQSWRGVRRRTCLRGQQQRDSTPMASPGSPTA